MPISTIKNDGLEGPVPVNKGGTGAVDQATALANLGAQPTLVSGTNIKTVGGVSIVGSGNVETLTLAQIQATSLSF